jgi:hypothetical protein
MQDPSDSMEIADPEKNGQSNTADSPVVDDPTPNSDIDSTTASMVLAEVLPGVAVVFGEVPAELKLDLIDFGLVSAADRKQISTVLASIGNTATVGGNLGNAFASAQGLYRLSDATKASMLRTGGTLAVKDGANLGTVISSGGLAQARFIPVAAVSAAGIAAAIGPATASSIWGASASCRGASRCVGLATITALPRSPRSMFAIMKARSMRMSDAVDVPSSTSTETASKPVSIGTSTSARCLAASVQPLRNSLAATVSRIACSHPGAISS